MIDLFSNKIVSVDKAVGFMQFFAKGDNWHKMDLQTGNLGYGWIHYGLIRTIRAKRVLCIGSRYGYIPAVCAMACRDNREGVVDFVDAGFDMDDFSGPGQHWGGVGFWKKCNPKNYFGKFGLQKNIVLSVMTSAQFAKAHQKRQFDYIYLDGDHSYEGVKADFELFWPRLKKGGFMALHDIGSPDKDGNVYGTRKFWLELAKKYKVTMQFLEDPGIGIVQKI
ncbi:MAG: class I SAM-dependent methyltransferase [Candidatus Shapirobacteria bacterium]|jgi:hypothetical protein